ncbi:hypothetical protein ACP4OV_020984 [Aristida adscensionis]
MATSATSHGAEVDALMELKAALDPTRCELASWARGGDSCGRGDYFEGVACNARGRVAFETVTNPGAAVEPWEPRSVAQRRTGKKMSARCAGDAMARWFASTPDRAKRRRNVHQRERELGIFAHHDRERGR